MERQSLGGGGRRSTCVALAIACAALFAATVAAQELKWRKYTNERFGFVLSYPGTLVAGAEAQNGSGREFHSRDKAFSLAVSAQFFHPDIGDTYEARWNGELSSLGETITYKKKSDTWYVVSGVAKDGTEYYHKTMRKGGNWVAFHITYPHAQNAKYDRWVEEIAKRFVPFLDGDYDRVD